MVPLSSRFDDDGGEMGTWLLHGTAGSILNGFLSGEKFTVSFKCLSASRPRARGRDTYIFEVRMWDVRKLSVEDQDKKHRQKHEVELSNTTLKTCALSRSVKLCFCGIGWSARPHKSESVLLTVEELTVSSNK